MISKNDSDIYDKIRYGDCEYIKLETKEHKSFYICKILKRDFTDGDQNNGYLTIYVYDLNKDAHCYNFECLLNWRTRSYYHPTIIKDESELMAMIL